MGRARRLCVAWPISLSKHTALTPTCSTRVIVGDNTSKFVFGGPGGLYFACFPLRCSARSSHAENTAHDRTACSAGWPRRMFRALGWWLGSIAFCVVSRARGERGSHHVRWRGRKLPASRLFIHLFSLQKGQIRASGGQNQLCTP